jgi:hypothetical protein
MSRHWNPEGEIARVRVASAKLRWPKGATAGLMLVAVACVGAALVAYRLGGPRDVFTP